MPFMWSVSALNDRLAMATAVVWGVERLADPNITVRLLATHEIVDRFQDQAGPSLKTWLKESSVPLQRVGALWILERLNVLDDQSVKRLSNDDDRMVRAHLVRALSERLDWQATDSANIQSSAGAEFTTHTVLLPAIGEKSTSYYRVEVDVP